MTKYFIIPGLGNSGPGHWQTWFEQTNTDFIRIEQKEWDAPHCVDWIETIDQRLAKVDLSTVVVIAHSLGCSTVAHWAKHYQRKVKAAMLVAPSDVDALHYNFPVTGFRPMPLEKISFPTVVVYSEDDQWVSPERAKFFADNWGSRAVSVGAAGHINAASGHNEWKQGLEILRSLG